MTVDDLKYLPACEVKDILEGSDRKSARKQSVPLVDKYSENVSNKIDQRAINKVKEAVPAETQFEGGYIGEFSRVTPRKHRQLMENYKMEKLQHKITE